MDGPGYKISQAVQQTASLAFQEGSPSRSAQDGVMFKRAAFLFQKQLAQNSWGRDNVALPAQTGGMSL